MNAVLNIAIWTSYHVQRVSKAKAERRFVPMDKQMNSFNAYQQATERTDNHALDTALGDPLAHQKEAMTNLALGIAGEAGEIVDLVKKVVYHGHEIDKEKFRGELGDLMWYIARMTARVGLTLEEVTQGNIDKLKRRYPEGFDKEKSINREGE